MRIHSQFTPKCINFSFQKFARFKIKNGLYHYIEISDIYLKKFNLESLFYSGNLMQNV